MKRTSAYSYKQEKLGPPENVASWNKNLKCTKVACNTKKIGLQYQIIR
jgi:hypothetical protein